MRIEGGLDLSNIRTIEIKSTMVDRFIIKKNDILFNWRNALEHVGKTAIIDFLVTEPIIFASFILRLTTKSNTDTKFLTYLFLFLKQIGLFSKFAGRAVNQVNLNANVLGGIKLCIPPVIEQRKIASILTNIDNLIQKTDQVIEQTQKLKKGLMQMLLTQGIKHKNFKNTELGEIPEEWTIKKIIEIGEVVGGGTPDTSNEEYWNDGDIVWAVPTDLTGLKTNYIDRTERYITKKGLENSAAKLLPRGSIIITSRATVGNCAINSIPMATNQGFQNLICNSENYNLFFLYMIQFNKNKLIQKSHGTTFLEISNSNIKTLKLFVPLYQEQRKIASILTNIDNLIQKLENKKFDFFKNLIYK